MAFAKRFEKGSPFSHSSEEFMADDSFHASTRSMFRDSDDGPSVPTGATVARDLVSTASSAEHDRQSSIPAEDFEDARYDFVQSSPSVVYADSSSREPSSVISELQPLQEEAYGGGLYGKDDDDQEVKQSPRIHVYGGGFYGNDDDDDQEVKQSPRMHMSKSIMTPRAGEYQSADGPPVSPSCKMRSPRSTGDRDWDITGQTYIQ